MLDARAEGAALMDHVLKTCLPGGATLLVEESPLAPVVALRLQLRVGSLVEDPSEAGFAHFVEHLVFRGTARRPRGRILSEIEGLGGEINAWTSHEITSFDVVIGSRHLDAALDVLTDMVGRPAFAAEDFEIERRVVLEEIRKGDDDPDARLEHLLLDQTLGDHALARPVYGDARVIESCDRDALAAFHGELYRAGDVSLVAVGDLDAQAFSARAAERLERLSRGRTERRPPPLPLPTGPRGAFAMRDVEEDRLGLALRVPSLLDPRAVLTDLLAEILSGGENAPGVRRLVRDEHWFNDVDASGVIQTPGGVLTLVGWAPPDRSRERLDALTRALGDLRREPLERAILDRTVRRMLHGRVYQRETVEGEASRIGLNECIAGDPDYDVRYAERLRSVAPEDLRAHVDELLRPEAWAVAAVCGARSEARALFADNAAVEVTRAALGAAGPRRRRRAARVPEARVETVGDGVRVVLRPDATVPILSAMVVMPGGQRFEDERSAGLTTLCADGLTRGAAGIDGQALLDELEDMGGAITGVPGRNSLGVQADFLAESGRRGLELLCDVVFQPTFPEAEIEISRRLQLEQLRSVPDHAAELGMDLLFAEAFPDHPYRFPLTGLEGPVSELDAEAARRHHARHLARDQVVFALVGDLDPEAALRAIDDAAPPLAVSAADPLTRRPAAFPEELRQRFVARQERKTEHLYGFPARPIDDPTRYAVELLTTLLAGQSGRLYSRMREDNGGVYDIDAVSWEGLDAGLLTVAFTTRAEGSGQAVALFMEELDRLIRDGVREEELTLARQALLGSFERSFQHRSSVAHELAYDTAYGLGTESARLFARRIDAVSRDALQDTIREVLGSPSRIEIVLGPGAA
jgi:zinc protease